MGGKALKLIFSIAICQLAGILGSFFTVSSVDTWYKALIKPVFSPPNWVFGPVWIILYTLMGISAYLVWMRLHKDPRAHKALWLFWIHLIFNSLWSIIFFGLRMPGLALIDILIIVVIVLVLIVKFWSINKWASYLLAPYFLWLSFAAALNFCIWVLN